MDLRAGLVSTRSSEEPQGSNSRRGCYPAAIYSLEYIGEVMMPRAMEARGLTFSLRHAPCAHICRYCLVSETRKGSKLSFGRFESLVHRFHDWKESGATDVNIRTFIGPSLDYDIDTLKGVGR